MEALTFFILIILFKRILCCGQLQNTLIPLLANANITHRWPWHAAVYHQGGESKWNYKCGGTLIGSNAILTAAHCVLKDTQEIQVSLGRLLLDVSEESASFHKVAEVIPHPDYRYESQQHDIAIIVLETSAVFDSYVQPVCLWSADKTDISEIVGKHGTVVGWELTETGEVSNALRQASLPVVDYFTCLESRRSLFGRFLSRTNFCAGNRNGTSVCTGDSGGSMTFEVNGKFYIRGIVSMGASKEIGETKEVVCDPMQYATFTDVAQYLPWIQRSTKTAFECYITVQSDCNEYFDQGCYIVLHSNTTTADCRIIFDQIPNAMVLKLNIGGKSDVIPELSDAAAKFRNLYTLALTHMSIKVVRRDRLTPFRNIKQLDLSYNNISQFDAADTFDDLTNLLELDIESNRLVLLHRNQFTALEKLEILNLHGNNLTTLPADLLRKNGKLRKLKLSYNQLTELHPELFAQLVDLKHLDVGSNRLKVLPVDIFQNNGKLLVLRLFKNQFTEFHVDQFKELRNLQEIFLGANQLETIPPDLFRYNVELRKLNLAFNQLTELHADVFAQLIHLEFLTLSKNKLNAMPAEIFRNNGNLRKLGLIDSGLKELHVDQFKELWNLEEIFLSNNTLETIPSGLFRNNVKLSTIDMGMNKIRKIEPDFCQITSAAIKYLILSGNVCIDERCGSDGDFSNYCNAMTLSKIFSKIQENC